MEHYKTTRKAKDGRGLHVLYVRMCFTNSAQSSTESAEKTEAEKAQALAEDDTSELQSKC